MTLRVKRDFGFFKGIAKPINPAADGFPVGVCHVDDVAVAKCQEMLRRDPCAEMIIRRYAGQAHGAVHTINDHRRQGAYRNRFDDIGMINAHQHEGAADFSILDRLCNLARAAIYGEADVDAIGPAGRCDGVYNFPIKGVIGDVLFQRQKGRGADNGIAPGPATITKVVDGSQDAHPRCFADTFAIVQNL